MRKKVILILLLVYTAEGYSAEKSKFIPDTAVAQFAGYIGFLSAGAGYNFRDDRVHLELLYGYVPESIGGIDIHMITGRSVFSPIKIAGTSGFTLLPFNMQLFHQLRNRFPV